MLYFHISRNGEDMAIPRDTRIDCLRGFVSPKQELPYWNGEEEKVSVGIPVVWYDEENEVYYLND